MAKRITSSTGATSTNSTTAVPLSSPSPHARFRACGEGDERGTAVVEFVLVAPVLLVILFAMLDLGKAFNYWIDTTQLASSGARFAVVNANPGGATQTL